MRVNSTAKERGVLLRCKQNQNLVDKNGPKLFVSLLILKICKDCRVVLFRINVRVVRFEI